MRWVGLVVVAVLPCMGCSRLNPLYGDSSADTENGSGTRGQTSTVGSGIDTVSASASASASMSGTGTTGSVDEAEDDADAVDDTFTSTTMTDETGCKSDVVDREVSKDAFMITGWGDCNGPCAGTNGGMTVVDVIEDVSEFERSYFLMTFEPGNLEWIDPTNDAMLDLWIQSFFESCTIRVFVVDAGDWAAGGGNGYTPAMPLESAWNWTSRRTEWPSSRGPGPFDLVVEDSMVEYSHALDEPTPGMDPELIEISLPGVLEYVGPGGQLHLAVTVTDISNPVDPPALASASESGWGPVLHFEGC